MADGAGSGSTIDFAFGADVEDFRAEVRRFLSARMTPEQTHAHPDPTDLTFLDHGFEAAMVREAGERGLLGVSIPSDLGGLGRSPSFAGAFEFEAAYADAPVIDTGVCLAGPPLLLFGSADQLTFARRMIAGEVMVCIAYTERQSGTDLTGLQMSATPAGGGFVLRGEKVLVTAGWKSDWCVLLARTRPEGPAREATSMFLVDLHLPGVSIRRRPTMNGWTLAEITFDEVRVGPGSLVGEQDFGWPQMLASVEAERGGMFHTGWARLAFDLLVRYCLDTERDGMVLADDPIVRDRVAALRVDVDAAVRLSMRVIWLKERGEPTAVAAAMTKVFVTELLQRLAQASTEIAGHGGSLWAPLFTADPPPEAAAGGRFAWEYLERVHPTVSNGGNELQRDVIALLGLGLRRRGR
jgi:alkylation response protein AidB-like acyl-CoA dehydrogenase